MINRQFFFDYVRQHLHGGSLAGQKVQGMEAILDEWEPKHAKKDDRWLAYMLGTTHHETDRTMWPIREYGRGKGRKYGVAAGPNGQIYYGRGFVQLTWYANYQTMEVKAGIPGLAANPDLALDVGNATKILFYGMINGSFTGKRLSDYFSPTAADWVRARAIINGTDKQQLVAGYAQQYYAAISYTTGA
jgi:putative chitinase